MQQLNQQPGIWEWVSIKSTVGLDTKDNTDIINLESNCIWPNISRYYDEPFDEDMEIEALIDI